MTAAVAPAVAPYAIRVRADSRVQGLAGTIAGLVRDGHVVEIRPKGHNLAAAARRAAYAIQAATVALGDRDGLALHVRPGDDGRSLIVDAQPAVQGPPLPPAAISVVVTPERVAAPALCARGASLPAVAS